MPRVSYLRKFNEQLLFLIFKPALSLLMLHALYYQILTASFSLMALPPAADLLAAAASAFELDERAVLLQMAEQLAVRHQLIATFQRALERLKSAAIARPHMLDVLLVRIDLKAFEVSRPLVLYLRRPGFLLLGAALFLLLLRVTILKLAHLLQNGLVLGSFLERFERCLRSRLTFLLVDTAPLQHAYSELRAVTVVAVALV